MVENDRPLEGFVESGFKDFGPLLDFLDKLVSIRIDRRRRQTGRRERYITATDGKTFMPEPFMLGTLMEILEQLRALEARKQISLDCGGRNRFIYAIWAQELTSLMNAKSMNNLKIRKEN